MKILQASYELEVLSRSMGSLPDGEIAEIGCNAGGSARIIAENNPNKTIHLFDTFEGFPDDITEFDSNDFKVGDCKETLETAKEYLKGYNVKLYKGRFPDTSGPIKDMKFAFVHIDVDIYRATKEALEFFMPRMVYNGRILIHDYPAHRGVKKAVDELINNHLEVLGPRQAIWRCYLENFPN